MVLVVQIPQNDTENDIYVKKSFDRQEANLEKNKIHVMIIIITKMNTKIRTYCINTRT